MSVVSAPTRAGRSLYNSEPSIEAPNPTTSVRRRNPKPAYPRAIRPAAGDQRGHGGLVPTSRGDARRPTARPRRWQPRGSHAAAALHARRPTSPTAVRTTYPSLRANPASTLDYVPANSLQIGDFIAQGVPRGCHLIQSSRVRSQLWKRSANLGYFGVSRRWPHPKEVAPNPSFLGPILTTAKVDPARVIIAVDATALQSDMDLNSERLDELCGGNGHREVGRD